MIENGRQPSADRLVRVAANLFRKKGYAATTTRELAAALGVQKATIYHYIANKEDLLYEISRLSLNRVRTAVDFALEEVSDPLARMRTLITAHLTTMLADDDMHATALIELRELTGTRLNEVIALRRDYEQLVEEIIVAGQAARAIRRDILPRHLALGLLNLINWTIFWFRVDGDLSASDWASVVTSVFIEGTAQLPASDTVRETHAPGPRRRTR
jgi:AcrR family transcriptional regulator